jgi:DNA-binding response OmpR family regulator
MDDKARILVVDDDLDLSEMLNAYFTVQDYEVETAAWGEDAIRMGHEGNFHLIVLDIHLPDIDGYEICRQLRTHYQTKDTPIIFLTEKRDRVDRLQGLELGVVDYITKPFDIEELLLRVRNAINRAAQQSHINPVTELPEGELITEALSACLTREDPWAVLKLHISHLSEFRERYGFVAADEVLRAVALIIRNSVRELGNEEDFIGHPGEDNFIVATLPPCAREIAERMQSRVEQSRGYFYPMEDRDEFNESDELEKLALSSVIATSDDGPFDSVDALLEFLQSEATA